MKRVFLLPLCALLLLIGAGLGAFGFKAYLDSVRTDHLMADAAMAPGTVDHSLWQVFLDAYLVTDTPDGIHRFDYRAAQQSAPVLHQYLQALTAQDPSTLSRDEALSYWLNLYNAGMVSLVLERGDYGSVIDNRAYYFLGSHFEVAGQVLSLDQIENRVIRVQWQEPRIHYALNCASLSCPNLQPQAFTGQQLDAQLTAAARDYINHPRGVAGVRGARVTVSEIFNWFSADFGGNDASVIAHLTLYANPALAEALTAARRLQSQPYDWGLNIARN